MEYFPGFTSLQLCDRISNLLSSLGQSPETFTGRILFMSMFNDISCDGKDNKEQCLKNADFVKTFAKRFGIGQWSFIGPGSEKKWYPSENSPQGEWDHIAEDMLLRFAESGHPIFRSTTPLSRGQLKSKGKGKVSLRPNLSNTWSSQNTYSPVLSRPCNPVMGRATFCLSQLPSSLFEQATS